MRDIRAERFGKTSADLPSGAADSENLLPEQSHLPAYYQALKQRGQVSMDGVFAILRDLSGRVEGLEGQENAPAPGQDEQEHTAD